jgi:type IV pilus assembly protein PilE
MMMEHLAYRKKNHGFSLIELMIVVAIIGILASISFPSYKNYIQKSRRTDAMSALINLEAAQENYRFSNTSYGSLSQLQAYMSGISSTSPLNYYNLTIPSYTNTSYTLKATAKGVQATDTTCATMTITLASGVESKTPAACWQGY